MWYFDRLPPDKKAEVRALYTGGDFVAVIKIYNEYKVSPDLLLPCCSLKKLIEWTNWAIHQGEI